MSGDRDYLRQILAAIDRIERYTGVGRQAFFAESHWQDATILQLAVVGEAVKRLSIDTRNRMPDIPWKDIAGMRDFLIHDYFGVDLHTVWETSQTDVPVLRRAIEELLSNP
ncbi:MAG TPA: DUF86 domain-containing protein [Thermoanaerobaculia bacterium]|nr:DUF86 domain-containing protein [Thermoanaerobaculia bacterium]